MKDLSYLTLLDIYGSALTQRQRSVLADYYERDFSLAEIADNEHVSRQAVHFAIKQAEESLTDFESKFRVHAFISELHGRLRALKTHSAEEIASDVAKIEELIGRFYGTVWQP